MRTFRVLHIAEIKEPLGFPVQFPDRVQFLFRHFRLCYGFGQRILQFTQAVPDLCLPRGNLFLGGGHQRPCRVRAAMAGRAGRHQCLALQRADQVMAVIGGSVFRGFFRHMAAGAVQPHFCVLAGQEGFHFRMLRFQHRGAGARLLPVLEAHFVIVRQDRFRCHLFPAGIWHHGFVLVRSKIVLNMALAAVQRFGINGGNILSQCFLHITVGDDNLAVVSLVVPMAGITGNRLRHLAHHFIEGKSVHANALFVHHFGEVRCLAGNTLGLVMGTGRL